MLSLGGLLWPQQVFSVSVRTLVVPCGFPLNPSRAATNVKQCWQFQDNEAVIKTERLVTMPQSCFCFFVPPVFSKGFMTMPGTSLTFGHCEEV